MCWFESLEFLEYPLFVCVCDCVCVIVCVFVVCMCMCTHLCDVWVHGCVLFVFLCLSVCVRM